ncbi:hypothetical protein ABIA06_005515 [Bradyrhizobium yuanmingense]|uniref:hypothetical protein n=1 Tax=Bradyrhizobium yuanmingense TaxID=108015 RepID=UPI0035193E31
MNSSKKWSEISRFTMNSQRLRKFKLECFLWTAEERIEWQETQRSIAEYLRELHDKRILLDELEE